MSTTTSKINLRKDVIAQIAESKNITGLRAQVVLVLDYSGSMEDMYRNGFVQRLIERIVPVAMQFDDNGSMELYLFENGCKKHRNDVNSSNVDGIINREILGKYSFGGTAYAPAVNMIVEDYKPAQKKSGIFGNVFGKSQVSESTDPVYVIFITDGANSDESNAKKAIIEASKRGIFFQFVGIGNATFKFLDELDTMEGRFLDNANFFQANDLDSLSDKELYDRLLGEFPGWVPQAKAKGLIG